MLAILFSWWRDLLMLAEPGRESLVQWHDFVQLGRDLLRNLHAAYICSSDRGGSSAVGSIDKHRQAAEYQSTELHESLAVRDKGLCRPHMTSCSSCTHRIVTPSTPLQQLLRGTNTQTYTSTRLEASHSNLCVKHIISTSGVAILLPQ